MPRLTVAATLLQSMTASLFFVLLLLPWVVTARRHPKTPPHRRLDVDQLQQDADHDLIENYVDIELAGDCISSPDPTVLDAKIVYVCDHILQQNCVGRPERVVPFSGKFEKEHMEWNWHCLHRIAVAPATNTNDNNNNDNNNNNNNNNNNVPAQHGHAVVQAVQALQRAVEEHPEWSTTLVATWQPVYKLQPLSLSPQQEQDYYDQHEVDEHHPHRRYAHHAQSVARRRWNRQERRRAQQQQEGMERRTTTSTQTPPHKQQDPSNDPLLVDQHAFYSSTNTYAAWNLLTQAEIWGPSASRVTLHMLDRGWQVDQHPDLGQNEWTNPGEICGDGIDNDNNGYIDDCHGWNFPYNSNTMVVSNEDHGTHCAGISSANRPIPMYVHCFVGYLDMLFV